MVIRASHPDEIAQSIDFKHNISLNNTCKGEYIENKHQYSFDKVKVTAKQVNILPQKYSELLGNVELFYQNKYITANRAKIYQDDTQKQAEFIELFDNPKLRTEGIIITGQYANINLKDNISIIDKASYRINFAAFRDNKNNIFAWGKAHRIKQKQKNQFEGQQASFTTCSPYSISWQIKAKEIHIDNDKQEGKAKHAIILAHGIPIFYFPYFKFPTTDARQSGFLTPTIDYTQSQGFSFDFPYYLNLAPNYDITLTPRYMHKHGTSINAEYRLLTKASNTKLNLSFLPKDKLFKNNQPKTSLLGQNRGEIKLNQKTKYNKYFSSKLDIHYVSDDEYLVDFNDNLDTIKSNILSQNATVYYNHPSTKIKLATKTFQLLSPSNSRQASEPYFILPKISVKSNFPKIKNYLKFNYNAEYSHFWHPHKINNRWQHIHRYYIEPRISMENRASWGHFVPAASINIRQYYLNNFFGSNNPDKSINKSIPIYTLDAGLVFIQKKPGYQHAIKPRILYTYIPHTTQNNIPAIHTHYTSLIYDSLYSPNRFTGIDRVGDANQITYGIAFERNNNFGNTIFSTGIAQIAYFSERKVTISSKTDHKYQGYRSLTNSLSPLIIFAKLNPSRYLSWHNELTTDIQNNSLELLQSSFQYKFHARNVINLSYTYTRNGDKLIPSLDPSDQTKNLSQLVFSSNISLNAYWNIFAGTGYNFNAKYFRHYFFGLEYNSCCFALRLLSGKSYKGLDANNNPKFDKKIYVQFVFKGLGSYNVNRAGKLLSNHIPGFEDHLT